MKRTNFYPQGIYDYRRYIANESLCIKLLKMYPRWNGKISCSRCKSTEIWRMRERNRVEIGVKSAGIISLISAGQFLRKQKFPSLNGFWLLVFGNWVFLLCASSGL